MEPTRPVGRAGADGGPEEDAAGRPLGLPGGSMLQGALSRFNGAESFLKPRRKVTRVQNGIAPGLGSKNISNLNVI